MKKKIFVFFLFDHVFVIYLGHTWLGGWKFHHFAFCFIPSSLYFLTVVLISKSLIFNFKIQQRREWSAIDSNCALFIVPRPDWLKIFGPWEKTRWLAQIPRPLTHDLQELHNSNNCSHVQPRLEKHFSYLKIKLKILFTIIVIFLDLWDIIFFNC